MGLHDSPKLITNALDHCFLCLQNNMMSGNGGGGGGGGDDNQVSPLAFCGTVPHAKKAIFVLSFADT